MTIEARQQLAAAISAAADYLAARYTLVAFKAKRDPNDPARIAKLKFEKRLADLLAQHFEAQRARVQRYLDLGGESPVPDGLIEDDTIRADLTRLLIETAQHGVNVALTDGLIDDTLPNMQAALWAAQEAGVLITNIDKTTLDVVRSGISAYISTPGLTLQDAMNLLPFGTARAELIATTEITRAYAEANQIVGEELAKEFEGVPVVKIWFTNEDDRVCEICGPLAGQEVAIDEKFNSDLDISNPPAHPNCRCWTTTTTRIA